MDNPCIAYIPEFGACFPITMNPPQDVPEPPSGVVIVPDTKPWLSGNIWLLSNNDAGEFWSNFSADHNSMTNDNFDGIRGRCGWKNIEATRGNLVWDPILEVLDICQAKGKKLSLSISSGINTPDHVYDTGAPVTRFPVDESGGGTNDFDMPLGFEVNYLAKWEEFVNAFAAALDAHPALGNVFVGGNGQQIIEFHITKTAENWGRWEALAQAAGYATKSLALRFMVPRVQQMYKTAFKLTPVIFTEGSNCWGQGTGAPEGKQDNDWAVASATDTIGLGYSNSFLHATSAPHDLVPTKVNFPKGFQPISPAAQDRFYVPPVDPHPPAPQPMIDLLSEAYEQGAQYCEIYAGDAAAAANQPAFVTFRPLLKSNLT